jgi:hypothetical protein
VIGMIFGARPVRSPTNTLACSTDYSVVAFKLDGCELAEGSLPPAAVIRSHDPDDNRNP